MSTAEFNQKMMQFQSERESYVKELQRKDEEISYLNSQISALREQANREVIQARSESDQLATMLADKLD